MLDDEPLVAVEVEVGLDTGVLDVTEVWTTGELSVGVELDADGVTCVSCGEV